MMSERVGNLWCRFEWCILNAKIGWSSNKFKKHWSARVTDEFSSETLILRKSLSNLYMNCIQLLPWPSLLFRTCYAGEMMIPCQVSTFSEFILYCFSRLQWFSSENKSVNAPKIANYVRKGWKLMTWIWIVHLNAKKARSCTKLLKYWITGGIDEFLSEGLILPKRLSSLYTKCIQFLP